MKALRCLALVGLLLPAVSNAQIELFNGFPETVSGGQGEIQAFYLNVPSGMTSLRFAMSGGSGDPDIYVNYGQPYLTTTDPQAECISDEVGTEELCEIQNPTAGLWYVEVYGYTAFTDVGLLGITATALQDGAPLGIAGAMDSISWYYIEVPSAQDQLTVATSGGSGDPDLYVVDAPDLFLVQETCFSEAVGPADSCSVSSPGAGRWYVLIYGYEAYSGVTLSADYSVQGGGGGGGGGAPSQALLAGLLFAALARRRLAAP